MNGSGEFGILDKQIDVLRTGGILPEKDILSLCKKVSPNCLRSSPACNARTAMRVMLGELAPKDSNTGPWLA